MLISGLVLLILGLLVITRLGAQSSLWVLFAAVCFNAVGAAIVETIEATVMLETAPVELSGAVAAVKSAVGQAAYSMGPAVFALVGSMLFVHSAGISETEARTALQSAHGHNVLDPQRAREVVDGVHTSMIEAIHTLGWLLTAVPLVAIVLAFILIRPRRD